MQRRSILKKASLGLVGLALVRTEASAAFGYAEIASTLEEAVRTGDPNDVKEFILTNPRLSRHSPLNIRLRALEILEGDARELLEAGVEEDANLPSGPPPNVSAATCMGYQQAGGTLLEETPDDDLHQLGEKMGGLVLVRARLAYYKDPALREVIERIEKLLED